MDRTYLKSELYKLNLAAEGIQQLQNSLVNANVERSVTITSNRCLLEFNGKNLKFYWNPLDPNTAISCLVAVGEYESLESWILSFFAKQSHFIIDVGANVGYYSVILGKLLTKDSKLLAFEPNPESFEVLQTNIILNNLAESIQPLCFALGEVEDSFDLIIPIDSGSSAASRMNLHPEESSTVCKVVQLKLDDFLLKNYPNRKIDLIKVDVEGGEFGFIKGALTTISNHKPVLFLELLRKWAEPFGYHPEDVRLMLEELGYFCFGISLEMPKIQKITEDTLQTNFLFVQWENLKDIDKIRSEISSIQAF